MIIIKITENESFRSFRIYMFISTLITIILGIISKFFHKKFIFFKGMICGIVVVSSEGVKLSKLDIVSISYVENGGIILLIVGLVMIFFGAFGIGII